MSAEAGVKGDKTNHSLRLAGNKCLVWCWIPRKNNSSTYRKQIMEALRVYKRVKNVQESKVSEILSGSMEKFVMKTFLVNHHLLPILINHHFLSNHHLMEDSIIIVQWTCTKCKHLPVFHSVVVLGCRCQCLTHVLHCIHQHMGKEKEMSVPTVPPPWPSGYECENDYWLVLKF